MDRAAQLLERVAEEQESPIQELLQEPFDEGFLDEWAKETPVQWRSHVPYVLAAAAALALVAVGAWTVRTSDGPALAVSAESGAVVPFRESADEALAVQAASPGEAQPLGEEPTTRIVEPVEAVPAPTKPQPAPSWRSLAESGDHTGAYGEAEKLGWSKLSASADAETLFALAEVARFSGHGDRARLLLMELRTRYPSDSRSALAAFYLGRMSAKSPAQAAAAKSWFQTYLREQPRGSLARDASGRLLELEKGPKQRRELAESYLKNYPEGPHAALARNILK